MIEESVSKFAEEIFKDVTESLSADSPFSQEIFTRQILERLEEAGHLEATLPLFQQGRVGNAIYRIDGYAYDEDRSRIELFTTIYQEDMPPERIPWGSRTGSWKISPSIPSCLPIWD